MTKNKAASVRQRLKNKARAEGVDFLNILNNYAIQKLLLRIAKSPYRENLLLKGSWLFVAWHGHLHRPTKDADMLGLGKFDKPQIEKMFSEITSVEIDDGLEFLPDSIKVDEIVKDGLYQGFRTTTHCLLDKAEIKVQVDLGFGDAVTPGKTSATIPCLLNEDPAELIAYPVYSAISEKWHAIVKLGIGNSRLKDYYDLFVIADCQELERSQLAAAIKRTFQRRETEVSDSLPVGLSEDFYNDEGKAKSWTAFLRKNDIECQYSLTEICEYLGSFLIPVNRSIVEKNSSLANWKTTERVWN